MRIRIICLLALLPVTLIGCAGVPTASSPALPAVSITGTVNGGLTPLVGAHVYLLAANTTGYGQPSVSLLPASTTGASDSIGAYVVTDATGHFSIPTGITCSSSTQVYLYALGGANAASGLLAAVGNCPQNVDSAASAYIINEVSTVGTAYAIAGFANDATHVSSSGSALATIGIANAFANAANLYNPTTGVAIDTTPAGNGTVPNKLVSTLADIIASCAQSSGPRSAECTALFANSSSRTGATPTDTATALINIAHNPSANVAALWRLTEANTPFGPTLPTQPNDFTIGVNYSGGGLNGPYSAAVDAVGDVWFANLGNNAVSKLSPVGAPISPAAGYTNGTPIGPVGISVDLSGNPWIVNAVSDSLTKYQTSGALLSPGAGFTGGGLGLPQAVASDAFGNIWVANYLDSVSKFSNGGTPISSTAGYTGGGISGPVSIALDASGSVWVTNTRVKPTSITKLTSAGQPISPASGYIGGGIDSPFSVAIDSTGNAWAANFASNSLSKLDPNGNPLSPSTGFTGGGLSLPFTLAIDGGGNVWATNTGAFSVSEFNSQGVALSPATGFQGGLINGPQGLALDGSGNVWIANSDDITVTELVGAAVPVVTPLVSGVKNNTLGTRP